MGTSVRATPPQGPLAQTPSPPPRESALTCAEAHEGDSGPGHVVDASTCTAS